MSERARIWGIRLLALGIALAIWSSVSLDKRRKLSEKAVEASVSYNRPRGMVILDPVQSVEVRVRGTERAIRQLNPDLVDVEVDLARADEGQVTVSLGPDDVLTPDGLEVVSVQPSSIRVELDREVTQRVPVEAVLVGEPADGATVEEPEVLPNQVLVTGPESLLARLPSLKTTPIRLDGRAATFEVPATVETPDPLIQIVPPSRVSVRVPMTPPAAPDAPPPARETS
ncbi:MAG TPA: CdaR family protein [Solirubrobacteraceae bacterium]|nr:CdaR family protein [Solirubrobacteraceae bacterium]